MPTSLDLSGFSSHGSFGGDGTTAATLRRRGAAGRGRRRASLRAFLASAAALLLCSASHLGRHSSSSAEGWSLPGRGRAAAAGSVPRRWPAAAAAAIGLLQLVGWEEAAFGDAGDVAAASGASSGSSGGTGEGPSDAGLAELLNGQLVYAITDENGSPALEPDPERGGKLVGRFYMEGKVAEEAFERIKKEYEGIMKMEIRQVPLAGVYMPLVVNGDEKELGGQLRIEPIAKEVRHAQQILDGMSIGDPGTVPLFMSRELELQGTEPGGPRFTPAFLYEKDLRAALKRAGAKPQAKGGPKVQVSTLKTITELYMKSGAKTPRVRLVDNMDFIGTPKAAASSSS